MLPAGPAAVGTWEDTVWATRHGSCRLVQGWLQALA